MINFNGDLLADTHHFLNHTNRGLRYGDALTEFVRYSGSALQFWESHYFRLMAAMRQLRMEIPMEFTLENLEQEIMKTIEASGSLEVPNKVSITVFRNEGEDLLPESLTVSFIIQTSLLENAVYVLDSPKLKADLFKDYYLQADGLARLPHNNRLPLVLASIYARENGFDTCLILNHRKEVCMGLNGNLFLRKGTEVKTPPLTGGCPDGILRQFLLKQSWDHTPYHLKEENISPFELQQADELFMIDIASGINSIGHYRKATYSGEAALYFGNMINRYLRESA